MELEAGRTTITPSGPFSYLFLALSGPLLIAAVVWYFTLTLYYDKNVPKMMGFDLGEFTKNNYPEIYNKIDNQMGKLLRMKNKKVPDTVWPVVFSDYDHGIGYETYARG